MASLKKKIIIGLIVIAVILFLVCLYLLYTTGWGDFTIEKFTNNNLNGRQIKIRDSSIPTTATDDGYLKITSSNVIRTKKKGTETISSPIIFSLSIEGQTQNYKDNGNITLNFNNNGKPNMLYHSSSVLYGGTPSSAENYTFSFLKLKNGKYFIFGYWQSKPYFLGHNYDITNDYISAGDSWDKKIITWDIEFTDGTDPFPIYTPIKQNNYLKDVAAIKITSSSTQYLTLAGLFVYDESGEYINLKDPKNGYRCSQLNDLNYFDKTLNSLTNLENTYNLNPVQSKTFDTTGTNPRYAKNILELANYVPNNMNNYMNSNVSTNTYRTLMDATNSNILAYNRPDRYNGLIYPDGLFSNGTFGFYSDTNPQLNASWYYRFADRTIYKDNILQLERRTFNISGVEIFTWDVSRSNNAKIEFIDKYNNVIATGNFDTLTENRRVFVVKNYPKIQGATDTVIKQVAYDAVYMDSSEYNRGKNINIPSTFPASIPTYSPTNVNYGFEQNKKTPDGEVYASGQFNDGITTYWASNIWYDSKSEWKVNLSLQNAINSATPTQEMKLYTSFTSTASAFPPNRYLYYTEYKFSNDQAIILKSYSITTGSNIAANIYQTPIIWDLLGSNDGINYYLIDTQDRTANSLPLRANSNTITIDKPSAYPNTTFPNNLDINNRTNIDKYKFKYFRLGIRSLFTPSSGFSYDDKLNSNGMLSLGGIRLYAYAEEDFPNPLGPPTTTLPATTTTSTQTTTTTTSTQPANTTTTTIPTLIQQQMEEPTTTTQQMVQQQMEEPTTTMEQMVQQQMQMEPTSTQYVEIPSLTSSTTQFIPTTTQYIPTTTQYIPTSTPFIATTTTTTTIPYEVIIPDVKQQEQKIPNSGDLLLVQRGVDDLGTFFNF